MLQMPFHDGRSFALFLKSEAKKKGISTYKLFEMGVIDKSLYYRYYSNKRDPRLSTICDVFIKLQDGNL